MYELLQRYLLGIDQRIDEMKNDHDIEQSFSLRMDASLIQNIMTLVYKLYTVESRRTTIIMYIKEKHVMFKKLCDYLASLNINVNAFQFEATFEELINPDKQKRHK